MPSLEIVLIRIDLFALHCFPHFIHVFNFPANFDFPFFFHFCLCVSPARRNFPKLDSPSSTRSHNYIFVLDKVNFWLFYVVKSFKHICIIDGVQMCSPFTVFQKKSSPPSVATNNSILSTFHNMSTILLFSLKNPICLDIFSCPRFPTSKMNISPLLKLDVKR